MAALRSAEIPRYGWPKCSPALSAFDRQCASAGLQRTDFACSADLWFSSTNCFKTDAKVGRTGSKAPASRNQSPILNAGAESGVNCKCAHQPKFGQKTRPRSSRKGNGR